MNDENNRGDASKQSAVVEASSSEKKDKSRTAKSKGKDKKTSAGISVWFKEIKAEAGKIIWPNRKELAKMTFTVVVTSLLFGLLIAGMDIFFTFITGVLSGLI